MLECVQQGANMSYTDWKYNPAECQRRIDATIRVLRKLREEGVFTHVVVSGSSGVTMLGALTMAGFKTVMVRKEGENTHGYQIEPIHLPEMAKWVFLDDFIATGATLRRVCLAISKQFPLWEMNGVVEHDVNDGNCTTRALSKHGTVTYGLRYTGEFRETFLPNSDMNFADVLFAQNIPQQPSV